MQALGWGGRKVAGVKVSGVGSRALVCGGSREQARFVGVEELSSHVSADMLHRKPTKKRLNYAGDDPKQ